MKTDPTTVNIDWDAGLNAAQRLLKPWFNAYLETGGPLRYRAAQALQGTPSHADRRKASRHYAAAERYAQRVGRASARGA